jgi:O-antigen ligase
LERENRFWVFLEFMGTVQQNGLTVGRRERILRTGQTVEGRESLGVGFFFLSVFLVIYCIRPEDWIPGLKYIPVAKVTAGAAIIALLSSAGSVQRKLKDLPREAKYLAAMNFILCLSAILSPVWKGGAISHAVDFAKVFVIYVLIFVLVTDIRRLRRIIYLQSASVVGMTAISIAKGYNRPRLDGVIGGAYSNPNDLAFAIVLCIPFCLAFLVTSKSLLRKCVWGIGILIMLVALFMTASRGGFIDLLISGIVILWHFGVRGRRLYLIVVTALLGCVLMITIGKKLVQRFEAISEQTEGDSAYGSYEERKELMKLAVKGIAHYPILGVGVNNFMNYSGRWREVHMAYLQIGVEGGIPALVLYLLFFGRGFRNLRLLRKRKNLPLDYEVFAGAMHASLIGFVVGALFGPEAYQFFPYFAVAYTSAMVVMAKQLGDQPVSEAVSNGFRRRTMKAYGADRKHQPPITVPR